MSAEYYREPWRTNGSQGVFIVDSCGHEVAIAQGVRDRHKIAERITACVNACEGTSNEALHVIAKTSLTDLLFALSTTINNCDELAASLEYYTTSTQDGKDDGMLARSTIERIFG